MSSILTNNGAMVALQTLKGINANMARTQSEISTGKSVATAKDNAAVWAIAKTMETDVASFQGIRDSLSMGQATVGVAREGAETIADLLKEINKKIVAAQEENVDRAKMQEDITQLKDQIGTVLGSAQFNGLNLINGSHEGEDVPGPDGDDVPGIKILASLNRGSDNRVGHIGVRMNDLSGIVSALDEINVAEADDAEAMRGFLATVDTQLQLAVDAAASFGSAQKRIEIQSNFLSKLSDAMTSGIGAMVDADMEEVSARLQALQVQQQLATQSLSIANQAPQALLSLFR